MIRSAMLKFPAQIQSKAKISYLELGLRKRYERLTPASRLDCIGYTWQMRQKSYVKALLTQAYNQDFTELRGSLARTKILIAFTKLPVNEKDIREISRKYPEEKIKFFNLFVRENIDDGEDEEGEDDEKPEFLISSNHVDVLAEKIKSLLANDDCDQTNS